MTKKEKMRRILPIIALCLIVCIALSTALLLALHTGAFSKLKYIEGYASSEYLNWKYTKPQNAKAALNGYTDAFSKEKELRGWTESIIPLMIEFVKGKYDIDVKLPKIDMRFSNTKTKSIAVKDGDNITLCLSTIYLENNGVDIHSVIIHECFHILAMQKGSYTTVANDMNVVSMLAEGFTDILTDEFIDSYNIGITKIYEYSPYNYYTTLLRFLFLELSEKDFAYFYFTQDEKFANDFNERFSKNSGTTRYFNAFEKLEFRLCGIKVKNSDNPELLYSYYSSLEMLMYFMEGYSPENKEKCAEYVGDIINIIMRNTNVYGSDGGKEFFSKISDIISILKMQVQFVPAFFLSNILDFLYLYIYN